MAMASGTRWSAAAAAAAPSRTADESASTSPALCGRASAAASGRKQTVRCPPRSSWCGQRVQWRSSSSSSSSSRRVPVPLVRAKMVGEDPDWEDDDYVVLGLGHCFIKDEGGKLKDKYVVEPIPAGAVECMDNGGTTCYKLATATTLGVALRQSAALLPPEFAGAQFCDEFEFRAKCASRTWKRDHPRAHLMELVPRAPGVRADFNFSLLDKRVLNMENVVSDSDNIKQDMSIDVYGRQKEEEMSQEIANLYSV